MKRKCNIGKILSDLITLIVIILWLWIIGSVIEVGTHNTEKGYTYSEYNLLMLMFSEN